MIAPVIWLREPFPPLNEDQVLSVTALEMVGGVSGSATEAVIGEAQLAGVWQLNSPNSRFGSYSALIFIDETRFLAGSDRGHLLEFDVPGGNGIARGPRIGSFTPGGIEDKFQVDLESLARDPDTGDIWAGFEGTNTIERVARDMSARRNVAPAVMRNWSKNSGAESMVRLKDGRFLVISEGSASQSGGVFPVLMFDTDPVRDTAHRAYGFRPPEGYRPVDAAQLPDGRVLILVRDLRIGIPPIFAVKLVVADLADLSQAEAGQSSRQRPWQGREIAAISDPVLAENYEGVAVAPDADGTVSIWLVSDDNHTRYQRSLLVKLRWDPAAQRSR